MSNIPGARVVRGGTEDGGRAEAKGARPVGPVLRLAPRALPRSLVVRILLGHPFTMVGMVFAAFGMVFVRDYQPALEPSSEALASLAFIALFPVVGLVLGLWPLRGALLNLRLLRYGREIRGKLVGKREANWSVNDVRAMALTFAYEVDGKPYTATVETLDPSVLEDDEREAMLYDPYDPSRATTLDHLPGKLKVNATGELEARSVISFHLLIAPAVFVGLLVATVIHMV